MRFFIKIACNFLTFSGNLNSLYVSDGLNNSDQEVQPQTENPNRKKQKKQEKKRICTGLPYGDSLRTLGHA